MLTQNDRTERLIKIFIRNIDEKQEYNNKEFLFPLIAETEIEK